MIDGGRCLGIILARGGSKRLPRKNLMMLSGKPLIQWTIEAGLTSNTVDTLIVSTDNHEIAEFSKACGAEIPFIRPKDLATDESSSYSSLEHAIHYMHQKGNYFDYIAMLQPTSPLRTSMHIDEAAKLLQDKSADGVISITEVGHPIQWCGAISESNEMSDFITQLTLNTRSQDFEKNYCLNGAIYLTKINRMLKEKNHLYGKRMYGYIMSRLDSIDIDEQDDFDLAELLLGKRISTSLK
jgi:CMP-N-acetylneuraminic acid synthetase